jgi:hypothetical protein
MSYITRLLSKVSTFSKIIRKTKMKFVNEAKAQEPDRRFKNPSMGFYSYAKPSIYLFQWSRLFQAVVSQAGTYALQNKFHDRECGIYKVEGGCRIDGVGELVLGNKYCYFDGGRHKDLDASRLAQLITAMVLAFDPMDPIDSLVKSAAENVGCKFGELKDKVMKSEVGGVFGGDPLSDFFDWNPFSPSPLDQDYQRWVLVEFLKKKTNEQVDQMYADKELGKKLLQRLRDKFKEQKCWYAPLCCSPSRTEKGELSFWINTGRTTNIDGRKTQKEIEDFLKPGVKIVDKARN